MQHYRPPVGLPVHAEQNARLNALLADQRRPLMCVHRGTSRGSVPENTAAAVQLAVAHGADIVEIDVFRAVDGGLFCFHTGYEPMAFGIEAPLDTLTSAEIEALRYRWFDETGGVGVDRLEDVLERNPDVVLNIDRSWWYWPDLLDDLAALGATDRLLLKSNADDSVARLAAHPTKFPYLAMVDTPQEMAAVRDVPGLNLVGFELHADRDDHPFIDAEFIARVRDTGMLTWVTALTLGNRKPQFGSYDDERSVLSDPAAGWGPIIDLGVDVIHTDWPTLLLQYLHVRGLR